MALFTLVLIILALYYQLFLFGKIPFPGDLLVASYSPWFDYYKIPVQNPLISDVFSQFFLWKYLAIDSFKNFQWPLWNPYSFAGTPLLATYHSATLYPLNVLLLLPKVIGWGLFIFSQTLIASVTMFLFLGLLTKSSLAKLTGSIMFALGGLMTTWLELGTAVQAMAWLPLALYAVKKFAIQAKFRFILILIISLFLIILAGNAQVTTYSLLIVTSYALVLKVPLLMLAIVLSLGLTAIQLLPSLDLLQNSIRQSESYTSQANYGLLPVKDILKFFIADFFGNPVTRNYWGHLNYSETSGFLGILTLPLLIYGLVKLKSREAVFFLVTFSLSIILTFDNPISRYLYSQKIPVLTSSYASRMLFVTLLAASVITALALNHLQNNKEFNFLKRTILWSWSAILGIILGTLLTYCYIALPNFLVAAKNSLVPFVILTIILVISLTKKVNVLVLAFLILTSLDLGRYFLKFNPFVSQQFIFPEVPALQFLQNQPELFRVGREHAEVLPPNTWIAYNLQSLEGYDPIYLNQYGKFIHFLNGGDIRTGNSSRYAELSYKYDSPFIDAANVKFFIGIGRDRKGVIPGDLINYHFNEAGYNKIFTDKSAVILENPKALPRVYFLPNFKVVNYQTMQETIMTESFDPRTTALLEKNLQLSTLTGKGQIKIVDYQPNNVKIETKTDSDELLILADQFEDGWKAAVDGKETAISRANFIFRAVKVPAGSHEIVFNYYPKSFDTGLRITLITLLMVAILALGAIKYKKF